MTEIYDRLLGMQEITYGDFSAKLVPTISRKQVIGVRLPLLRRYAKELAGSAQAEQFMQKLPHKYLEENHLHSFLIGQMRDVDQCYAALDAFLPYVDNWAVCDSLRPQIITKDKQRLLSYIDTCLQSEHAYTVRFGIELLMLYFLDEDFDPAHLARVAAVQSGEYYTVLEFKIQFDVVIFRILPPHAKKKTCSGIRLSIDLCLGAGDKIFSKCSCIQIWRQDNIASVLRQSQHSFAEIFVKLKTIKLSIIIIIIRCRKNLDRIGCSIRADYANPVTLADGNGTVKICLPSNGHYGPAALSWRDCGKMQF